MTGPFVDNGDGTATYTEPVPFSPYATAASLQALPRMAGYSDDACDSAIAWAQGVIDDYTERHFGIVTDDVAYLDPHPGMPSLLDDPPVTAVSKVEGLMGAQASTLDWTDMTAWTLWTPRGEIYDATGLPGYPRTFFPTWPVLPQSLRVTYTHGYATVPQPVINAVLKLAAAYIANPEAYIEKRIGDNTFRWLPAVLGQTIVGLGEYTLVGIA